MAMCDPSPLPFMFSWKVSSLEVTSGSRSPKAMMSTLMPFFLRRLASFSTSFEDSETGEQVKTMMRWCWDLFWRCLRASWVVC